MWSICIIHYKRRGKSATSYCTCKESFISYVMGWVRPFWKHNRCLVLRETLHHWLSCLRACGHWGVISILAWEPARGSWILGLGGFPAQGGATAAEYRGDAGAEEQRDRLNGNHNVGADDIIHDAAITTVNADFVLEIFCCPPQQSRSRTRRQTRTSQPPAVSTSSILLWSQITFKSNNTLCPIIISMII